MPNFIGPPYHDPEAYDFLCLDCGTVDDCACEPIPEGPHPYEVFEVKLNATMWITDEGPSPYNMDAVTFSTREKAEEALQKARTEQGNAYPDAVLISYRNYP